MHFWNLKLLELENFLFLNLEVLPDGTLVVGFGRNSVKVVRVYLGTERLSKSIATNSLFYR